MNYYNFHINDFNGRTWHLSNLARWIYRDLISLYYENEKPLANQLNELAHKLRLHDDDEKTALREVLAEFFTLKKGKYHHKRIDREIKNYQYRNGVTNSNENNECVTERNETSNECVTDTVTARNALSNAQRQAKLREQAKMFKTYLSGLGIDFDKKISFSELKKLFLAHGGVLSGNETSNECVTDKSNGEMLSNAKSNGKNHAITNNQKPITKELQQQQSRDAENFGQPEKPIDLPTPFDRFAMHANWQPADLDTVNGLLRRAGLPSCETGLVLDAALDFVAYWAGRPEVEQTAAQWDGEFVRSAVKYRAKHGHKYDTTTWELQQVAQSTALAVQSAVTPNAPSKTKQSAMTLQAVRQAVVSGSLKTVLSPPICLALVDGLMDLLGNNLRFPPAADAWEWTLTAWANEFARYKLGDDDVQRVQTAFQAAKRQATHPDNPERRYPDVADVLACLPMRFVPKIEQKLSPDEWAEKSEKGRANAAELLKNISKNRIQAA